MEIEHSNKFCTRCNEIKSLDLFYNNVRLKDKKSTYCKKCTDVIKQDWQKNNKDKCSKMSSNWSKKNHKKVLIYRANAKSKPDFVLKNRITASIGGKKASEKLTDGYVISCLKSIGFTKEEINKNKMLIEVERLIIKIKRKTK